MMRHWRWEREMLQGFTAPRSPLGIAALVPPPPWHFAGDVLAVEFWNDPDLSIHTLPAGVEPTGNVRATPLPCLRTTSSRRRTTSILTPLDILAAGSSFCSTRCS